MVPRAEVLTPLGLLSWPQSAKKITNGTTLDILAENWSQLSQRVRPSTAIGLGATMAFGGQGAGKGLEPQSHRGKSHTVRRLILSTRNTWVLLRRSYLHSVSAQEKDGQGEVGFQLQAVLCRFESEPTCPRELVKDLTAWLREHAKNGAQWAVDALVLQPCDIWQSMRGRTTWVIGDSVTEVASLDDQTACAELSHTPCLRKHPAHRAQVKISSALAAVLGNNPMACFRLLALL